MFYLCIVKMGLIFAPALQALFLSSKPCFLSSYKWNPPHDKDRIEALPCLMEPCFTPSYKLALLQLYSSCLKICLEINCVSFTWVTSVCSHMCVLLWTSLNSPFCSWASELLVSQPLQTLFLRQSPLAIWWSRACFQLWYSCLIHISPREISLFCIIRAFCSTCISFTPGCLSLLELG